MFTLVHELHFKPNNASKFEESPFKIMAMQSLRGH